MRSVRMGIPKVTLRRPFSLDVTAPVELDGKRAAALHAFTERSDVHMYTFGPFGLASSGSGLR